jgi:hypothetical protein
MHPTATTTCLPCRHLAAELAALRDDIEALRRAPDPALLRDIELRHENLTLFARRLGDCGRAA